MDMRFCTWNVRNMYKAGSVMRVQKETSKYKLDFVGVRRSDGTEVAPIQLKYWGQL
jgi:hypothetical protein